MTPRAPVRAGTVFCALLFLLLLAFDAGAQAQGSPSVTYSSWIMNYTENGPPVPVDAGLVVSDPSDSIYTARVFLSQSGPDDVFEFTPSAATGDIVASFNPFSRELTLNAATTRDTATWQAALRAVTLRKLRDGLNSSATTRIETQARHWSQAGR